MNARALVLAAAVSSIGLSLVASRNFAQNNEVDLQFHSFQDSRGVTVLSPTADLNKDLTDRTSLRVNFGVDAISAASDSCARCHRDGVNSRRQAVGLSITRRLEDTKVSFGGSYSKENFYRSTTFLTSISRNLAKGNTTIAGGYTFSLNQPTLHPTFDSKNQYDHDAYVAVTQTLSKTTIAQAGYEVSRVTGYLDNPYLRANVNGIMVLGQVPGSRVRQTESARLRQALPANTYLEADYRHYSDDWQIRSNSIDVGLSHHFSPKVLAGFDYRRYDQTGAYFWEPDYVGAVPQFFTADFRLEPFASDLFTGKLTLTPGGAFWGMPKGWALMLQYDRYRANNGFDAGIASIGLRIPLGTR